MRSDISAGLGVEGLCSLSWPGPWASFLHLWWCSLWPDGWFVVLARDAKDLLQAQTDGCVWHASHWSWFGILVVLFLPGRGRFWQLRFPFSACGQVSSLVCWGRLNLSIWPSVQSAAHSSGWCPLIHALRFSLGLLHKLVASVSSANTCASLAVDPSSAGLPWLVLGLLGFRFRASLGFARGPWLPLRGFGFGAGVPVALRVQFVECWLSWFCFTLHARPRCTVHHYWATS